MPIIHDRYIVASNLSEAWIDAVEALRALPPPRKAVHLVVRIEDTSDEIPGVRAEAQRVIDRLNIKKRGQRWAVDTTRSTIFPATWASRLPEPEDLANYYRARYPQLRKFENNAYGTYFGRIVAYPREEKHANQSDQLTELVRKLREEIAGSHKSSRYEVNIFSEQWDTNPISFPCLAHLSFHVHQGRLHLQAVYRNEFLIGRAYGNYWGLAELQKYVAAACPPLLTGELLICVNHAELDAPVGEVDEAIRRARAALDGRVADPTAALANAIA